ncbi:uncharacterized protein FIBRA_02211 [Fibroporia radiculosa]|uniref:AB hydrolase-1 domain-containing protein n=1 Tax=Fibroporia radiculosa TaxID=599839 RepID=J4G1E9_9APHY|nr:uncharacterized protein FIBRA_02211 [Fibroporia radiculosa]CCM00183.1 predicted protein [Fibroporia radiculosa]
MDSKHGHESLPITTFQRARQRTWWTRVPTGLLCLSAAAYSAHTLYSTQKASVVTVHALSESLIGPAFDWNSIKPSTEIEWTPCFAEYQCARLILPLDYLSPPGVGPNVTIALQMFPATDKESYKGTILINPGGPGVSGTNFVMRQGRNISYISGGSFDVLGFDPRGTGASTPLASCFNSESAKGIWNLQAGDRLLNLSDGSVGLTVARERAVGALCKKALGGNGREDPDGTAEEWGTGRFMSTPSVATDMLRITEKLGQEKLKYWGFSYGSVLGQYFAAMYPDKVDRLIIDGVLDGYDYRSLSWNTNLVDTDAVWESFFTFCSRAGAEKCPLYMPSAAEVKARVTAIMDGLEEEPLAVPFAEGGPLVVTRKAIYSVAFQAAHKPVAQYAALADMLLAIEQVDQSALATMSSKFGGGFECNCEREPPELTGSEAFRAIACGDGEPVMYTPKDYEEWFTELSASSSLAAPIWGVEYLRCTGWQIRPKWRYMGPLAAEKTSHPILIISPTHDTVCPLSHARQVHTRYGGSGLLVQRSFGHCSSSAPSLCTAKYVREYFINGTLPEEGTICDVDELPFLGLVGGDVERMATMPAEDERLLNALRGLADGAPTLGYF